MVRGDPIRGDPIFRVALVGSAVLDPFQLYNTVSSLMFVRDLNL